MEEDDFGIFVDHSQESKVFAYFSKVTSSKVKSYSYSKLRD